MYAIERVLYFLCSKLHKEAKPRSVHRAEITSRPDRHKWICGKHLAMTLFRHDARANSFVPFCYFVCVAVLSSSANLGGAETPSQLLNDQLPKWVRVAFDHRFRMEGYTALRYRDDNDDRWFLNRLRMTVTLLPRSWWSLTFQGQDSRIFFKSNAAGQNPYTNRTDLRMAFTDLGSVNKGSVALRVGRQELAYGDERVIGAANWGNVARTFDAAKLVWRRGAWRLDLVSAAVILPQLRGISHHLPGDNVHFAYGHWENPLPHTVIEPYILWRAGNGAGDALAGNLRQDRRVGGVRAAGSFAKRWNYTTEWLVQGGQVTNQSGKESIRAFAQHSVLRYSLPGSRWSPRLLGEFNYASGDRTPGDGRSGTFDQLFPTPHEKYGLADQVGWQNIEHVSAGLETNPTKALGLKFLAHDWRLAQSRDGLYAAGGALVFRDLSGHSGRHVGGEADVVAQYNWGPRYVGAGYGHLFPGTFTKHQSPGAGLNYIYLNVGYGF
jgi:Alginate export